MLIILFGLSGSGKSFVGNLLVKNFHYFFWDADEELTEEMRQCISDKKNIYSANA